MRSSNNNYKDILFFEYGINSDNFLVEMFILVYCLDEKGLMINDFVKIDGLDINGVPLCLWNDCKLHDELNKDIPLIFFQANIHKVLIEENKWVFCNVYVFCIMRSYNDIKLNSDFYKYECYNKWKFERGDIRFFYDNYDKDLEKRKKDRNIMKDILYGKFLIIK